MLSRLCDKCGKPTGVDASIEKDVPDYAAYMAGMELAKFDDLCDVCKKKVSGNTEKFINVRSRTRRGNDIVSDSSEEKVEGNEVESGSEEMC